MEKEKVNMAYITGLTRDKREWTPQFIVGIDEETCIGCGRCYKVCIHDVLAFEEVDEDESAKMFMKVANPGNCIGCQACGRTCSKKCFTFEPVAL
jgi:Nif-specific ferredoxin III